jgi:protein phosphatase
MPWSVKAHELISQQYAAVGAAGRTGLANAIAALSRANSNINNSSPELANLLSRYQTRAELVDLYVQTYRRYCWPINSLADIKVAPFHLMATEGTLYLHKHHRWHMETLGDLCSRDPELLLASQWRSVAVDDRLSCQRGLNWWTELTERGEEGMVVKPFDFLPGGPQTLIQPAIKCRGREYLRIIYGPEYTNPEHLERLRFRGLAAKRSLALREFSIGIQGLERFIPRGPLKPVHECAFGVLALESEPVDIRL